MIAGPRAVPTSRPRARGAGLVKLGRSTLVLAGLAAVLAVVSLVAMGLGEEYIPPQTVLGMALQWLPIHPAHTWSDVDVTIVTMVRLPRILTAIMVGGSLAAAGTAFQALFRNPLADPGIVGTSAGASLGAIIALALPFQVAWLGYGLVSVAAFVGALASMLLVYSLARVGGRLPSTTLLLAGFAVTAMLNAIATVLETFSGREREMFSWLLGSLDQNTVTQLAVAVPLLTVGTLGLMALSGDLNVLLLGDEHSWYLGLNVAQRRLLIMVLGSLLTSVAVALSGLIVFVGLLVPHLARLLFGANNRLLVPTSILLGAIFLLVVDTVARMIVAPQELPVGLVTALLGAPWFIVLLRRKRGEYSF